MHGRAFLQTVAVLGIWAPLGILLLLYAIGAGVASMHPIPRVALVLPFLFLTWVQVTAHLLVLFASIGVTMLVSRKALHPKLTWASTVVGFTLGLPALAMLYLNAFRH